ncbi:UDP-glucose 4-epimerase GalE [Lujinxingia litoralis]|uniref:UDP-glucose 4-epimerase n=1 Tax=Lujinxingia litoralis TaxID=2211119 RepID=A0A328C9P9_9DELT|nr:UDP-glucose 4-epimerase GalE [Lujinxingia litoralis]RAL23714.1 UDP-glucose 4-epimerase GalE [Lujinxingia litoralis]
MSTLLVTGGAGYIGSHVAWALVDAGHHVVILDNLSTGVRENIPPQARLVIGDVGDAVLLKRLFTNHTVDAILHFAGSIVVPESVENPLKYYDNNTTRTRTLLEAAVTAGVPRFVFSSTAAVYGEPAHLPVTEDSPTRPINPYGRSKLMTEWMLEDVSRAHPLNYVALRYFNVAGADPAGRTGQSTPQATHLIKVACQLATGQRESMAIFGTDYPTDDGTCVRDYIHVSDLADAHLRALEFLAEHKTSAVFNCGYGHGYSVRQVVSAVERVVGKKLNVTQSPRRAGDPPELISDPTRLRQATGWEPRHDDLETIVKSALDWEAQTRA